jgi:hypothetical protein
MTRAIADQVPADSPGAREIGFALPQTYNAVVSCSTISRRAAATAPR